MNIIEAAQVALSGRKVRRRSWKNEKCYMTIQHGQYLFLGEVNLLTTEDDQFVPEVEDILANDWEIYEEPQE